MEDSKSEILKINASWFQYLKGEFEKKYMKNIFDFLEREIKYGKIVHPEMENIFSAFNYCPFNDVSVVIIGQDPYHGKEQAHGLSFSVSKGTKVPPSLKNIYKELESEFSLKMNFTNGNLENWAKQGVLLLNSVLTVENGLPASHSKIGWQNFTDTVITTISKEKKGIVFLLWGAFAISKINFIDESKHLVLTSPHPSPFSAYKGFFGNNHFLKTNEYLKEISKKQIIWKN